MQCSLQDCQQGVASSHDKQTSNLVHAAAFLLDLRHDVIVHAQSSQDIDVQQNRSMEPIGQGEGTAQAAAVLLPVAYAVRNMMDMPEALLTILLENMFRSEELTHSDR